MPTFRHAKLLGIVVGLSVLAASASFAQTTGELTGRVSDPSGAPLPGVSVEATGPTLQGSRGTYTDDQGEYKLALLPPGAYRVAFTLEGLGSELREGIAVGLGRGTTLNVQIRPTASEQITVTAAASAIDTTSTNLGVNLDVRAMETLPTGRNYASIVQVTPGISTDANPENSALSTITVYGSSGAENSFYVDGVNTTGVEYGFQGKELNFEFIEAIDVKTGGYEAEYGRSTGGVINVITKSGGNEFHGDVFVYYDNDSLQSSPDPIVSTGGTVEGFIKKDFGLDIGGYLVRDRLWFFAAYDVVENSTDSSLPAGPQRGQIVESTSDRDLAAGKLTLNLRPGQSLIASLFQDPRTDAGAINDGDHRLNGEPATYLGEQKFGGLDLALRYEGILGPQWIVTAQVARHEEENSIGPATTAGQQVEFRDSASDNFQTGGFGLIQDKEFTRDAYGASIARAFGEHELKFGFEFESEEATVVKRMSGGQRVDILENTTNPARPVYSHFYWTTPDATLANAPTSALIASPGHDNTTAYLQDRWHIGDRFTLSYGLRWDRQEIFDRFGDRVIDLKEDYAPRLGLVWDPRGDSSSKVFASYGKYFEQIPMDLVVRSFSQERQARIFNYSPTGLQPDAQAEADIEAESKILGGFSEPADPNLKNQYIDEFLLGGEREVRPNLTLGAKAIYRKYGRVIEDFLCIDDGTYCIGNPGEGIMKRVFTYDYSRTLPAPEAKRTFKGVQLDVTKRLSNNWQGLASYLYSKLDGNYDGGYAPFTNVGADPNISAAYDYFDFFTDGRNLDVITNQGPLSNDRRHQFKMSGVYFTPWKLSLGGSATYRTGTPLSRYGFSDGYGRYEFFLTPRGAEGRQPATYEMDWHFGYPLETGPVTINFLLDIFNVLNAQRPVLLDQRWGFQEADNSLPAPTNPGYGKPILRTPPTSVRLGVRLSL
jgi:hypothetical protein